jgi:hypothetical protein
MLEPRLIKKESAKWVPWIIRGVCTGLRGEKMLLIDLFGTAKSVTKFMRKDSLDPHFKFVIIGRMKTNLSWCGLSLVFYYVEIEA